LDATTHSDDFTQLSLNFLGDIFLNKELDGETISVLEYGLKCKVRKV
jgi:hypothetical protein